MKRILCIMLTLSLALILAGCGILGTAMEAQTPKTEEELSALSDADLVMAVTLGLDVKYGGCAAQSMDQLNESQQVAYTVATYDLEVLNGGLCQYFTNSSRYTAPYLEGALITVGAPQMQALFSGFVEKYKIDLAELSVFEIENEAEYEENYARYPFDEFDEAFMPVWETESLEALNAQFIRNHISDFI